MSDERKSLELRRSLLRSFPDVQISTNGSEVVDALVQGGIIELLNSKGSAALITTSDIGHELLEAAGLEYEQAELVACLERLERQGFLQFRSEVHKAFVFSEERYLEIRAQREHRDAIESDLRTRWSARLREQHGLDPAVAETLWGVLDQFVTELVQARAEEAAAFLYMNDQMGQVRFYSLVEARLPALGRNLSGQVGSVAREEVSRFFNPSDKLCVEYLSERLHAAFYYHLLSLDPLASALVVDRFRGKLLYLDTNFLFRLLGLEGATLAYSPAVTVDLSRKLDCRLRVAQETLNEFVRSLRAGVHKLRNIPLTRDTYRRIAAEHPTDDIEFMQAFYREWNSGRVNSAEEFERKYTNLPAVIEGWGIEIDRQAVLTEVERNEQDFRDRFSELSSWHNNMEKPLESIEHDVFLWRYIRRLRGAQDNSPGEVPAWLVTYDRHLTIFSVYYATAIHQPFCILANDWLQIIRPFLPRTEDYERSFSTMLAHPLLFQEARKAVPFEHVVGALHRLERYEELPTPLVAAMIADGEFVRRIHASKSDAETRKLIEIHAERAARKVAEENEELKQRLHISDGRSGELESKVSVARQERRDLERRIKQATKEKEALELQAQAMARGYEERISALADQASAAVTAVQSSSESETARLRRRIEDLIRWVIFAAVTAVLGVAGAWLLLGPLANSTGVQKVVAMAWVIIAELAALAFPLRKRAIGIILFVIAVLGGIAASYQVWVLGIRP